MSVDLPLHYSQVEKGTLSSDQHLTHPESYAGLALLRRSRDQEHSRERETVPRGERTQTNAAVRLLGRRSSARLPQT